MKAAVYEGKERILVKDVPDPVAGDGEVILKIEACNLCGADLRTYRHGDKKITPPRILGHEFCGTIAESKAKTIPGGLKTGDRVVMYIVLPCGACRYCMAGMANLCESRTTMSYQHDGAFAQFMKVPAKAVANGHLFKVDAATPPVQAALAEPLGCTINAHGQINIGLKDTVAVIGAGPIGIMHAVLARIEGAQKVYLLDVSDKRLGLAKRFGFDALIPVTADGGHIAALRELTGGYGPSVVIVACSVAQAQVDALEIAGKAARVNFFGGLPKSNPIAPLDTNNLHYKEIVVSGAFSEKMSDFQAAQALVQSSRFPGKEIVTHTLPLAEIAAAFTLMETGESLKVCIQPNA